MSPPPPPCRYNRFAKRYDLTLKGAQKVHYLPKHLEEKRSKFLRFGIRYQKAFGEQVVFVNGDQTRIYYAGQDYAKLVAPRGQQAQTLVNHADESKGVTLMMTIVLGFLGFSEIPVPDLTGAKFPPWVVFAGKGENPGVKVRKSLAVLNEKEGWSQELVHFNA